MPRAPVPRVPRARAPSTVEVVVFHLLGARQKSRNSQLSYLSHMVTPFSSPRDGQEVTSRARLGGEREREREKEGVAGPVGEKKAPKDEKNDDDAKEKRSARARARTHGEKSSSSRIRAGGVVCGGGGRPRGTAPHRHRRHRCAPEKKKRQEKKGRHRRLSSGDKKGRVCWFLDEKCGAKGRKVVLVKKGGSKTRVPRRERRHGAPKRAVRFVSILLQIRRPPHRRRQITPQLHQY